MDEPSAPDRATRLSNLIKTAPPFVVCREELAWFGNLLPESGAGQPGAVLVPGEAGIDKTRLLQSRLFFAVSRTAIAVVQRCPTILFVHNLHWADRSSLDLVGHLTFTMADATVHEPEKRPAHMSARLQREHIWQTFPLPGLNESEVYELIQRLGEGRLKVFICASFLMLIVVGKFSSQKGELP
jgi:hypothetical protein